MDKIQNLPEVSGALFGTVCNEHAVQNLTQCQINNNKSKN
mgnify:CR=1 FL=1